MRKPWASLTIMAAIVLPVVYSFGYELPQWLIGVPSWAAAAMLWSGASRTTKIQAGILAGLGIAGLIWGVVHGNELNWGLIISANALILAMLASIGFLRLLVKAQGELSNGRKRTIAKTALGVHAFGSVINMSILYIMADRLTAGPLQTRKMSDRQAMILSRCFGAAAFWSPFFAAMGVALTWSPGANITTLMIHGVPLAAVAIAITVVQAIRSSDEVFLGYPINPQGLALPVLLAVMVFVIHQLYPDVFVIAIICLVVPPVSVIGLVILQGRSGQRKVRNHILHELPKMPNELLLFVSSGLMAAGIASIFSSVDGSLPYDSFGPWEASGLLGVMLLLSVVGVHPVIAISVSGTLLMPLNPSPDLLASTFLCAWAIGVAISPLSAMNLAMQARFGMGAFQVLRVNSSYGVLMFLVASAWFHVIA